MNRSTRHLLSGLGCGALAVLVAEYTQASIARPWYLVMSLCLVLMGICLVLLGQMEAEAEAERARRRKIHKTPQHTVQSRNNRNNRNAS